MRAAALLLGLAVVAAAGQGVSTREAPDVAHAAAAALPSRAEELPEPGATSRRASASSAAVAHPTRYVAHYMPWFEEANHRRGNHWCDEDYGNAYYASVFGRYGSNDASIIRRQVEMMKAVGLDGVWIDLQLREWLPAIQAVVAEITRMGMNFAIVIDNYADPGVADAFAEELTTFMNMPNYYKVYGRPILPFFEHPERSGATKLPSFRTQGDRRPYIIGTWTQERANRHSLPNGYDSFFFWSSPDMRWLKQYYEARWFSLKVGGIYRGWREAYIRQANSPPYLGFVNETLRLARKYTPYFAQLVTWNDYTEGTMLEPAFLRDSVGGCTDWNLAFWHNRFRNCSSLWSVRPEFSDQGRMKSCAVATDASPCSGSGKYPCAWVRDCSKPIGAPFAHGAQGCEPGMRSAYDELASVALDLTGVSVANATILLQEIFLSTTGEPDEGDRYKDIPAPPLSGATASPALLAVWGSALVSAWRLLA